MTAMLTGEMESHCVVVICRPLYHLSISIMLYPFGWLRKIRILTDPNTQRAYSQTSRECRIMVTDSCWDNSNARHSPASFLEAVGDGLRTESIKF